MSKAFRILLVILSIITGATFLYSAYTKILPIQPFEYTLVEYIHLPWLLAAIGARFLIGLEAGLGALLLFHLFGRNKWVLKIALTLLVIFSIYLIVLWAIAGNNVNCGCFGDAIWMSPSTSLIKNILLMIVIVVLIKYHKGFNTRWARVINPALLLVAIALPFILFPIILGQPSWLRKDKYKIDFQPIYNDITKVKHPEHTNQYPAPSLPFDLNKGKYIVAFLSPSCPHCRMAARKMHLMKVNNPTLPFFFVIGGTASDLTDFWKQSNAQNIPYKRLEANRFMKYTGGIFPLIIWVNDGWVEAKSSYNELNQPDIEKWIK